LTTKGWPTRLEIESVLNYKEFSISCGHYVLMKIGHVTHPEIKPFIYFYGPHVVKCIEKFVVVRITRGAAN